MAGKIAETPLMKQYIEMKGKHPDAILLFRVGDFYETFSSDAIVTSEILGITLTRRANGAAQFVELAGFPHHALDAYLPKLVRAGKRVAICDVVKKADGDIEIFDDEDRFGVVEKKEEVQSPYDGERIVDDGYDASKYPSIKTGLKFITTVSKKIYTAITSI